MNRLITNLISPDEYIESLLAVNLNYLKNIGIKALLIDIDNTILPPTESNLSVRFTNWFNNLHASGFKVILITNSLNNRRVSQISEHVRFDVYCFVCKPFTGSLAAIIKKELKLKPSETVIIGDKLFTDILAGNILRAYTILVKTCDSLRKEENNVFKNIKSELVEKMVNS